MQRLIAINLNGNTYQLDEHGYEALRAYLEHAEVQLGSNPDASEILRDLEQSIAEKCQRFLGPGKGVVTTAEIAQILREIGPVENAGAAPGPSVAATTEGPQPRRLYQIREGAMISGVCNGIAAYMNIDPTIVRIAFLVAFAAVALTSGDEALLVVLFYVVLVFIVPYAKTPEQLAAAQGSSTSLPYKVQQMVELVKARFPGLHPRVH
jgi:phage shock protein PspC (stress-responsive transcriptional regulator)